MARLDEIAEGLATLLTCSQLPEPLTISLRGESPTEVTFLVRAIVDSCERRGMPISSVLLSPDIGSDLDKQYASQGLGYEGVKIEISDGLVSELHCFRFPRPQS